MQVTDKIQITNEDNMALMARYPDKYFDLAIVDPPYGIGFGLFNRTNRATNGQRIKANKYKNDIWDTSIPTDLFFNELIRVTKSQICFGGNYFPFLSKKESINLKKRCDFLKYINESSENWLFWNKQNPVSNFADGELAWLSKNLETVIWDFKYFGNIEGKTSASVKYHPTQKPIDLYKFCLDKYSCEGQKILDTHLGSGSIAIACHDYGFELTACELDEDYYNAAIKRLQNHVSQLKIF